MCYIADEITDIIIINFYYVGNYQRQSIANFLDNF